MKLQAPYEARFLRLKNSDAMISLQDLILRLLSFWGSRGCVVGQPYGLEVGAGTFNPLTFCVCLDRIHGTWHTWSPVEGQPMDAMPKTPIVFNATTNSR